MGVSHPRHRVAFERPQGPGGAQLGDAMPAVAAAHAAGDDGRGQELPRGHVLHRRCAGPDQLAAADRHPGEPAAAREGPGQAHRRLGQRQPQDRDGGRRQDADADDEAQPGGRDPAHFGLHRRQELQAARELAALPDLRDAHLPQHRVPLGPHDREGGGRRGGSQASGAAGGAGRPLGHRPVHDAQPPGRRRQGHGRQAAQLRYPCRLHGRRPGASRQASAPHDLIAAQRLDPQAGNFPEELQAVTVRNKWTERKGVVAPCVQNRVQSASLAPIHSATPKKLIMIKDENDIEGSGRV
ncbi:hypothetical protein C0J52_20205 [Blattella germanica]|nr:hypothetical protein C0J52_20205 [Blattella germanica]